MNSQKYKVRGILNWTLILNYTFFILLVCFFRPYFETNDDSAMRMIVTGVGGVYDSHLVYSNILIGKLIVFLEMHVPIGNWYTVVQLMIVFFSFCTITCVLMERIGFKYGFWISVILLSFFGYEGYIAIQFTKTAGFAATAGMVLFAYTVRDNSKKDSIILYMISAVLVVIGSMVRFNMALLVIVIFSGALFIEDVGYIRKSKGGYCKMSESGFFFLE